VKRLLLLSVAALSLAACTRIEPGHVGVKVSNWGSGAGVDPNPYGIGYYWTFLTGTSYYQFPVSTTTHAWTKSPDEGNPADESISFQDQSGLGLNADVSVSFHTDSTKAPVLFQTYRMDTDGIVDGPLRNEVRNAIVERASNMPVEQIYGPKKAQLIAQAQTDVSKFFAPKGLIIDQLYWASNIRLPDSIRDQINARIANEQQALAAQANVATVEANARAKVAEAQGLANATRIQGEALSANPQILQQRAIEKWDGHLPTYLAPTAPLPFIGGSVR
jgi:regulator of protease activity HflC (stomatin/prohibitin superfamily)